MSKLLSPNQISIIGDVLYRFVPGDEAGELEYSLFISPSCRKLVLPSLGSLSQGSVHTAVAAALYMFREFKKERFDIFLLVGPGIGLLYLFCSCVRQFHVSIMISAATIP